MPKKNPPNDAPAKKRVLIVDDHPIFRAGLTGLVNLETELTVCGEANDAAQAMQAVEKLHPDLVLLDMSLPGKGGLELLKDIRAIAPQMPVLIISMHDETLYAERVIKAGGRGYIMKQEGPDKMRDAITKVLNGQVYASGDAGRRFSIQSISKPFVYGVALEDRGRARVAQAIGVEPSGDPFNASAWSPAPAGR